MDDLVAVRVELEGGESRYFLTWGRIQDAVRPEALAALVLKNSQDYSLGGVPIRAVVCGLREASSQPYFFEGLFSFAKEGIPSWPRYRRWKKRKALLMGEGKDLYYLGKPGSD